ncbi:4Fe-4S dicluster domain-containing protein [Maridesulfovibrio frigidus]|uniref:4Fe-4S dicluster domain-containing protein n=1 Tax=Maridesulfovibrio frigidus TaxID=340956 RepID=UPI000A053060|nr:FAD-dependent oxidoreductase [Maridesulfovibrio frigidus]
MKRIFPDKEYCIGCKLCELACLAVHSKSKDLITAYKEERVRGLAPAIHVIEKGETCVAVSCRHCVEPACADVCKAGALSKDAATGIVHYNAAQCIGCWSCLAACPYDSIKRNKLLNKIIKCDLCSGREDGPACVSACPNRSLKYEERSIIYHRAEKSEISFELSDGCGPSLGTEAVILHGAEDVGALCCSELCFTAALLAISKNLKRAVVVGSGHCGLKAAESFYESGVEVAIIEEAPHILPQNSDGQAASLISRRIKDAGLMIKLGTMVNDVVRDDDGRVKGVLLSDRSFLEAGAVVFANGVTPDDCVAGNFASKSSEGNAQTDSIALSSISFCGLAMVSAGILGPELDLADDDVEYDSYFYCNEVKQILRKLVFKDQLLVGYILVGDIESCGILTSFIQFKLKVDAELQKQLCSGRPNLLMWPDKFFDKKWNPEKS